MRKAEARRIAARLKAHAALMERYMAEGDTKAVASKRAYDDLMLAEAIDARFAVEGDGAPRNQRT